MLAGERIRLYPTEEQIKVFKKYCGAARFAYNACVAEKIRQYKEHGINIGRFTLQKYAGRLKYMDGRSWLKEVTSSVVRVASQDASNAFDAYFRRSGVGYPKFKKKGKCKEGFGLDANHCKFFDQTHIKISKIKEPVLIKCHWIPEKIYNPRISFDGKYWYFSFSYEVQDFPMSGSDKVVGVDLGIKNLAVTSDGVSFGNINKSRRVRQLEKRLIRLRRKLYRKYEKNGSRVETSNIRKLKHQIRLINRKLKNIRDTYIHQVTYALVKTKPGCIVIEDLDVSGMLKNKYLRKKIKQQSFYKFRQYLTYKCQHFGIGLVIADRYFPSSKTCSCCGHVRDLSLSDRVYICPECGLQIDRDLNAAINLRNYGEDQITQ